MTPRRLLLIAVGVITALLVQQALLSRLPGVTPPLLLVVVVALALVDGPLIGAVTGFAAGLLADLTSGLALGRTALVLTLAGYLAGTFAGRPGRSRVLPHAVLALAVATVVTVFAGEALLIGDRGVTAASYVRSLLGCLAYCAALGLVVLPGAAALLRATSRRVSPR